MAGLWDGVGALVGKVVTFIPGRIEGLKDEKQRLIDERDKILSQKITARGNDRLIAIDLRVSQINGILSNNAKD